MKRRNFIKGLFATPLLVALPVLAQADKLPKPPIIGYDFAKPGSEATVMAMRDAAVYGNGAISLKPGAINWVPQEKMQDMTAACGSTREEAEYFLLEQLRAL